MSCGDCRHIDSSEQDGYKWYCTWYKSYEDPESQQSCSHYDSAGGSASDYSSAGKCESCRNVDPSERSGYRWYCTYYRSYEDPEILRECAHYSN
jgi:hypothetical protein